MGERLTMATVIMATERLQKRHSDDAITNFEQI